MRIFIYFICLSFFLSCSAFREIEQKDSIGRVVKMAYYDGSQLEHLEEIEYVGNTYNPDRITFYKMDDYELFPFKYEVYAYNEKNITSISVLTYENEKKTKTGYINFTYTDSGAINSIEYHTYSSRAGLYLIGLDQHTYDDKGLAFRRIIKYQLNSKTGGTMQKAQYQVFYCNKNPCNMKYGIIDRESNTIVEKKERDPEVINEKIKSLEKFFLIETIGRENIIK